MQTFDTEQEWLDARGIATASEIGAILGHSLYDTPHDMWLYATGQKKKVFTQKQKENMERGKTKEAAILAAFHKYWFSGNPCHYNIQDQAFFKKCDMSATLDRFYWNDTERIVVEAKSTEQKWFTNHLSAVPLMYLDQVYFQMILSDADYGFVVWEENNFRVDRDEQYESHIVSQAEKFVFCVEEQVPFEPDYYPHPMLKQTLATYEFLLEEEKIIARVRKELKLALQGNVKMDSGVWSVESKPVKSSGFSAPKLREVFAGQEDLLEQCRYKDSVKKEIVFTPNLVDEQ